MKIAIALACLAALCQPTLATETCRGVPMPPASKRAEPTVPYQQLYVPRTTVARYCGNALHPSPAACAYQNGRPAAIKRNEWVILISDDLKAEDVPCVIVYEKSHLPPNNWFDDNVENTYHYNPN